MSKRLESQGLQWLHAQYIVKVLRSDVRSWFQALQFPFHSGDWIEYRTIWYLKTQYSPLLPTRSLSSEKKLGERAVKRQYDSCRMKVLDWFLILQFPLLFCTLQYFQLKCYVFNFCTYSSCRAVVSSVVKVQFSPVQGPFGPNLELNQVDNHWTELNPNWTGPNQHEPANLG